MPEGITSFISGNIAGSALNAWIARRKKRGTTNVKIVRYLMGIWVDFAFNKVKTTVKGSKPKIESDLMRIVSARRAFKKKRRGSKAETKYASTLAERVCRLLNYKDIRGKKGAEYYRVVGTFVRNRMFSAWHHKAGFYPIYEYLGRPAPERSGPRYQKHPTGYGELAFKGELVSILVENIATAAQVPGQPPPLGISGLAGGAFEDSVAEIERLLAKQVAEDMIKDGEAVSRGGFEFTRR